MTALSPEQTAASATWSMIPVNDGVVRVHSSCGLHVGNLKRVGALWKFKAVGFDVDGAIVPGGGPLTDRHNTVFTQLDQYEVNAALAPTRG